MQTDAVSLCREYRKNSLAFMDKYKDKSISVSGKIKQIHENQVSEGVIVLDGYGSGWSFKFDIECTGDGVECIFDEKYKKDLIGLQIGKSVNISGVVRGKWDYIGINDCHILSH